MKTTTTSKTTTTMRPHHHPSLLLRFLFSVAVVAISTHHQHFAVVQGAPSAEQITNLPDYGPPPTPHYSGFLDATDGCDTSVNGDSCYLHYWLCLADTPDPWNAPIVLWLNGGPGSSSILGLLQENGPLLINATGGLMDNPYAWTNVATLIAIESPIGVGYSYCSAMKDHGQPCENTDRYTASASRAALVDLFTNKFPELAANELYITGESYAGIYIPTLSKEILDNAADVINLKGIAVGDPCTDNTAQADSMDSLWYAHKYGLVDDEIYDLLWNQCEARVPNPYMMQQSRGTKRNNTMLEETMQKTRVATHLRSLVENRSSSSSDDNEDDTSSARLGGPRMRRTPECQLALRKFMLSSSHALSQGWRDLYIDDYSLFAPVTSQEDQDMATYMSRPDARAALHVEDSPTTDWPVDPVGFHYTKEYDACNDEVVVDKSMIDFYKDIVPRLDIAFVYNGDTDPCVSYEGTRRAIKQVGFDELDGGSYRPWFYNHTATTAEILTTKSPLFGPDLLTVEMGAQFGGEVTSYEHGLSFLTFHGSGHMVPQFRPQAALHMLTKLIKKQSLSPLLPSNATLTKMCDKCFHEAMEGWTETAMSASFIG